MSNFIHDRSPRWQTLLENQDAYWKALTAFTSDDPDYIAILDFALRRGEPEERRLALRIARDLTIPQKQLLFPTLVFKASWVNGLIFAVRDLIVAMPRDWVLAHIEAEAEQYLEDKDDTYPADVYRRFMELYLELGGDLLHRLIQRAAMHPDPDVREAAKDFVPV